MPVTRSRRVVRTAAIALTVVALFGIVLVLFAPLWVHLDLVRRRIEAAASSAVGGEVTIERIDLTWLPGPEVAMRHVGLSVPGRARGTLRNVKISLGVPPLLRGRVRITRVRVDGPDLAIDLPEAATEERPASGSDPMAGLTVLLRSLGPEEPGLRVEVSGARLAVSRSGASVADLRDVAVSVAVSPKARAFHAEVEASVRVLSVRRGNRRALEVGGLRLAGAIDSGEGRAEGSLSHFSLESPRILVEGTLRARSDAPRVELTARGSGLDVTALREKLLEFAGDDPTVGGVFSILRGGTLTGFSFAAAGRTPAELGVLERMSISATLADGSVRIGSVGLDLADASGDVSVERGVLSAEHAAARIGNSRVWDGSVRVGLGPNDDTLRVEARVRSDLAELPPILSRALRGGSFRDEISLVEKLSGSATGRLTLENRNGALKTTVSVSEMRLSASYERFPWPVRIREGTFFYEEERIGVNRLSGSLGASTLSGLRARLRLANPPFFEDLSGSVEVSLDELYPWLASREGMEALRTTIWQLRGSVGLSISRLSGPISRPGEWQYEASGSLRDLALDTTFLPASLEIGAGEFRIDPETIRVSGLAARTMDASLAVAGTLDGYLKGLRRLDGTVDGELGPESVRWTWERASLPADFRPAPPIALHGVHLGLVREGALSLAGDFTVRRGPRVSLDLVVNRDATEVRRLAIHDGASDASISTRLRRGQIGFGFSGNLEASTVEGLLERRRQRHGRIEGNFSALLPLDHPGEATAGGRLEVTGLAVPTPAGEVTIERLGLSGARNRLDVTGSSLVLGDERFSVTGGATFRDEGILLDMDVATDRVSLERLEEVLGRLKEKNDEKEEGGAASAQTAGEASRLRVRGALHVSIGSFRWRDLEWKPVLADVLLEKESTAVAVRQAELCGLSTTGELRFLRDGALAVEARVHSAGPDVNAPLSCLGLEKVRLTGSYDASLQVEGAGEASELLRAVRGPLTFRASKGRIGKATWLTRILAVANVTGALAGKTRDHAGEAMTYDELSIEGDLGDGSASLREGILRSSAFTMAGTGSVGLLDRSLDLMVLTHPLSTVDKVIQKIPILRYVLGGDFLSVAATVSGTLDDPKVSVTPGRDVSAGLVHILERTAKLPVRVLTAPPAEK